MTDIITELGYYIINPQPSNISVTAGAETSLAVNGKTCYIQNVGTNIAYVDTVTGVDNTKWELAPGERSGPWTAHESLFFKGAGNTTIKAIFIKYK